MSPTETHKYYGVTPVTDGNYTIGHEKQHEILADIDPCYRRHYEETEAVYLPNAEYNPNFSHYEQLEKAGSFILFTVREGSTLVGYLQYHVYSDLHAQGAMTAREDAFYLLPEHRGSGISPKLLAFAEHFLKKLGCIYVGMTDKSPIGGTPIGYFLQKKGYGLIAHYYVKELE